MSKQHNNSYKLVFISLLLLNKQIIQFLKIFWPGWKPKLHRAKQPSELWITAPAGREEAITEAGLVPLIFSYLKIWRLAWANNVVLSPASV